MAAAHLAVVVEAFRKRVALRRDLHVKFVGVRPHVHHVDAKPVIAREVRLCNLDSEVGEACAAPALVAQCVRARRREVADKLDLRHPARGDDIRRHALSFEVGEHNRAMRDPRQPDRYYGKRARNRGRAHSATPVIGQQKRTPMNPEYPSSYPIEGATPSLAAERALMRDTLYVPPFITRWDMLPVAPGGLI